MPLFPFAKTWAEKTYPVRRVNPAALANAARVTLAGMLRRPNPWGQPASLDIILTKACNLRCVFCISYESLEKAYWMDFGLYERIARELFPKTLSIFFCSGGEPLLYPRIRDALLLARQHRTLATMTSNGMLLDREVAAWMVEDQSLQELCISFDGATKQTLESIRRGARFETILENIAFLSDLKRRRGRLFPRLWFRFAIMRRNAHELPDAVALAARHGLYKVEVKYLNVANDMDPDESLYHHPELAAEVFAAARAKAAELGVELHAPALPGQGRVPGKCLKPWQFCQIDTDGSLRICYFCWKQRLGFVQDGFMDVWNGEHYQKIRASIDSETPYYPYCAHCVMRHGPDAASSHDRSMHEDAYAIPGLEHLQSSFNQRGQENVASFRQLKTRENAAEQERENAGVKNARES